MVPERCPALPELLPLPGACCRDRQMPQLKASRDSPFSQSVNIPSSAGQ